MAPYPTNVSLGINELGYVAVYYDDYHLIDDANSAYVTFLAPGPDLEPDGPPWMYLPTVPGANAAIYDPDLCYHIQFRWKRDLGGGEYCYSDYVTATLGNCSSSSSSSSSSGGPCIVVDGGEIVTDGDDPVTIC